jgi:hypothetical protein
MSPETARPARPIVTAISTLMLLGALAIVLFAAVRSPLKDDIAWLFYVARRWMAGRELYVDVIEVNPPLIIWISAIPLSIANWFDVSPTYTAIPGFAALVLACAWWSACLLRPKGGIFADRLPVFSAIGCVLLLVPGSDLGQREHLLVAAFLPYLIVFARTLSGLAPSRGVSIAAGVLAGLGCALKPQYAMVFAALEGVALYHRIRPWRAAPIAAGATLTGYVGLVAVVCPAYLRRAVPLALALYGATDVSFSDLLRETAPLLGAEALALFLWWRRGELLPRRTLMLTGIVFAMTSNVVCFVDAKDWFYHRLPATVVTLLVLVLWTAAAIVHRQPGRTPWRSLAMAGIAVALFCAGAAQRIDPEMREAVEPRHTTVARLEDLIRENHARTYVAFSEWLALGFPVVNNTGVMWASRFDSMWALKGEVWRAGFDKQAPTEWPVARWVAHDFIAGCPDIAVVDTRSKLNYIRVLSTAEPSFARAWSRYHPIASFDRLTVYKRGKGGCIDPWVAAEGPGGGTTIR